MLINNEIYIYTIFFSIKINKKMMFYDQKCFFLTLYCIPHVAPATRQRKPNLKTSYFPLTL